MVKRVSGYELVDACVRTWVGLQPSPLLAPECSSLLYAIRYPRSMNPVGNVVEKGEVAVPPVAGLKSARAAMWSPLCTRGHPIDSLNKEVYLGEVHIMDPEVSHDHLKDTVGPLYAWLRDDSGLIDGA
jgi:hypothetical protein